MVLRSIPMVMVSQMFLSILVSAVVLVAEGVARGRIPAESQHLDAIAADLAQHGFFVDRVPYLYTGGMGCIGYGFCAPDVYSYNNVLIERYTDNGPTIKRVYMPW